MSTRLSNSDSAGLQCHNNNLINVLRYSEAEHTRTLAVVQQLQEIAGPSLLRRYLPSLLSKVAQGESFLCLFRTYAQQVFTYTCHTKFGGRCRQANGLTSITMESVFLVGFNFICSRYWMLLYIT